MSFELADAHALLEDIRSDLAPLSAVAADGITAAVALWDMERHREAFEAVIDAVRNVADASSVQLPRIEALSRLMHTAGSVLDDQSAKLDKLQKEVQGMKKAVHQLEYRAEQSERNWDKAQQLVLLGQVAYTMSRIIKAAVYSGKKRVAPTLQDMANADILSAMDTEQKKRWEALKREAADAMDYPDLLSTDGYLRRLRNEPAHDSTAHYKTTTEEQLQTWASLRCLDVDVLPVVKKYITFLGRFSEPNRPLSISAQRVKEWQQSL
jgi:uncharacterized protein YoxC